MLGPNVNGRFFSAMMRRIGYQLHNDPLTNNQPRLVHQAVHSFYHIQCAVFNSEKQDFVRSNRLTEKSLADDNSNPILNSFLTQSKL